MSGAGRRAARLLGSIAMCAVAVPHAAAQRVSIDWSEYEAFVAQEMAARGIPGAVIVVANDRRVLYITPFGVSNVATREPLTTAHRFQVGSITKTYTALLALQLAIRGDIRLDAPVGEALTRLPPGLASLTLRDLLHQRAGLRDVPGDDGPDEEGALGEWTQALGDTLQVLPPRTAFSYSNAGYALAGAALERWTGRPFADLMQARFFAPLGMKHATMRPAEAQQGPVATGHGGAAGAPPTPAAAVSNDTRLWPAGYAWSSGEDMGRFLLTLVGAGMVRGSDGLYRGVVDSALVPAVEVPGLPLDARYGLGMFRDRTPAGGRAWHPGNVSGFSALWRMLPRSRIGVAVLVNRDAVRLDALADSALATVAARGPAAPPERVDRARRADRGGTGAGGSGAAALTREAARALEGRYEARFPIELRWSDGALRLTRFGTTHPVVPLGGDRYQVQAPGASSPEVFTIHPASAHHPAYVQMALWAFVRRNP